MADEAVLAQMQEFIDGADAAAKWAAVWKVRAQLIQGATWAFYGDDGKIKVVGAIVSSKANGPSVHATRLYEAAEWALRCGTGLVVTIGNRKAKIEAQDVVEAMTSWTPYVSDAGVMVALGPLFHGAK